MPHIFEIFSQARKDWSARRAAWAWGCRWCAGWCSSTEGASRRPAAGRNRGSEFTVHLPAAAKPPAPVRAPRA
jgi:hypothetical protein